jgi:uncharacterized protein (TIGR03083 family)
MPDDAVLDGVDPYDAMDAESARIDHFVTGLGPDELAQPSACEGWSVKDVVGHMAASEEYNHACLDDAIGPLFERISAFGVNDVNSFNAYGVEKYRAAPMDEVLGIWRQDCARTRRDLRQRDGGDLPTMVGAYPVRWQAFHLASELATHADDIGVPVAMADAASRTDWRARFAVFARAETNPEVVVDLDAGAGQAAVTCGPASATLSADELVAVTNGRLPAANPLDAGLRSALNVVGS